jgi:hypothetical protein
MTGPKIKSYGFGININTVIDFIVFQINPEYKKTDNSQPDQKQNGSRQIIIGC